MTQFPIAATSGAVIPLDELRDTLNRALILMDELQPSSISAARLQQIVDELDESFGANHPAHS